MLNNIEEAWQLVSAYSSKTGRLGVQDLIVLDVLFNMYDMDMGEIQPEYLWTSTPDVVMESIIDSKQTFVIDYGWEQLYDSLRDFLTQKSFIVHCDDVTDEEYQDLMEASK